MLGTELNLTHEVINAMEIQLNQRTTQIVNMQIVREQEMQIIRARVIDLCTAVIGITHPVAPFPPHDGETKDQNEDPVEAESNSDVDFVMWEIAPDGQNQHNVGPAIETHDRILERFLQLDPPIFHGEPDDMRTEQWLEKMESILTALHYNEEPKLMLVIFRLEAAARDWWRAVEERWNRMGTERTWENFVQEFRKQYIPRVVRETRRDEFHHLQQGSMTVTQYKAEFHRLSKYAPGSVHEEEDRLYKFTRGLRPKIQRQLLAIRIYTYDEAVEAATQVESGLSRVEPQSRGNFNPPRKSFRKTDIKDVATIPKRGPTVHQQRKIDPINRVCILWKKWTHRRELLEEAWELFKIRE
ncbi:hypothetical protein DH2020_000342 [Rehmannia glutinosa]|uniref:Retrotransposon gag domain-containing protein n=1 Tax=Rehmannia glutinosa TaxID=99300 RepID=A0ABR0XWL7_REHGL